MIRNAVFTRGITVPIYHRLPVLRGYSCIAKEEEPPVYTEQCGTTRSIIFNRPKKLNAIDPASAEIFSQTLQSLDDADDVNLILFKGRAGGRALSAGGDVKFFYNSAIDSSLHEGLDHFLSSVYGLFHKIGTVKTPTISVMNGLAMGYGLAISTFSPFSIATEKTKISMPETRFGHFCDVGSCFYLPRLNGHIGKYMALTAHTFQAEDTVLSGLATHFVPSDQLEEMETELTKLHKPSHDEVNDTIEKFSRKDDHIPAKTGLSKENRIIIDSCFKHDTAEEILTSLEKNGSQFALDTIDQITKGSPIGVKLTAELHRQALGRSLKECLELDHHLWQISPFQPEFQEGINVGIIQKQVPNWIYPHIQDVDLQTDILEKYFFGKNRGQKPFFLNDIDYHINPHSKYKLPTESVILQERALQKSMTDDAFIAWYAEVKNNKFGIRQHVEDVITRKLRS